MPLKDFPFVNEDSEVVDAILPPRGAESHTKGYTPAPWIEDGGSVYTKDGHLPIAHMERDANKAQGIPPTERDANAKLIAAAPEMLAAIEGISGLLTADFNALENWRAEIDALLNAAAKTHS